jgi:hypothetical protein
VARGDGSAGGVCDATGGTAGLQMMWTGQPPVQVDSCTGRGEDLMAGWHWYDYLFGVPLGMVGVL